MGSLSISTENASATDQDSKRAVGEESNRVSVLARQRTRTQDSVGTRWLQAALPWFQLFSRFEQVGKVAERHEQEKTQRVSRAIGEAK